MVYSTEVVLIFTETVVWIRSTDNALQSQKALFKYICKQSLTLHGSMHVKKGCGDIFFLKINPYSAGIDLRRRNLTSVDVRF